jgi:hypothetical protein
MALKVCQHNFMFKAVLQFDLPSSSGSVVSQITSESRNGRNNDDDSELAAFLACSDTSINDGLADLVVDGCLLFSSRSNEELVLDVNKVLCVSDDLTVCVLNTVLSQDTTRPIGTASHELCMDGALDVARVRSASLDVHRRDGVVDVLSNRMLRPLDCNQILILAFTALESKPIETLITLVLVTLDKVPAQLEVLGNIVDTRSDDTHSIVPWHASIISLAQLVALPILDVLEIHDTVVVEVLSRENFVLDTGGVSIGQWMLHLIPTTEAKIQTSDEGQIEVDDDKLLMMRPAGGRTSVWAW